MTLYKAGLSLAFIMALQNARKIQEASKPEEENYRLQQ